MRRWILALASIGLLALPGSARALSIGLDSVLSESMGMDFITFNVSFTPATAVTGYDLSFAWDAVELEFASFSDSFGGFGANPAGTTPSGERASRLILGTAVVGPLFSVTFKILSPTTDSLPDFRVFVGAANGPGVGSPPGQTLTIDNGSAGVGFDVAGAPVPEPWVGLLLASALPLLPLLRRRS